MHKARWVNGKRSVTGTWKHRWENDTFYIFLDQKDRTTGDYKTVEVRSHSYPEWGNWKLDREFFCCSLCELSNEEFKKHQNE